MHTYPISCANRNAESSLLNVRRLSFLPYAVHLPPVAMIIMGCFPFVTLLYQKCSACQVKISANPKSILLCVIDVIFSNPNHAESISHLNHCFVPFSFVVPLLYQIFPACQIIFFVEITFAFSGYGVHGFCSFRVSLTALLYQRFPLCQVVNCTIHTLLTRQPQRKRNRQLQPQVL